MDAVIQKTYNDTRSALNYIYKKRKRSLFFQKIMWGITGLFFVFMILVMVAQYFPSLNVPQIKQFQASVTNPYANVYPMVGFMVFLYITTYSFSRAFQKFKIKEGETITKMVKTLFPKVDFTQGTAAPQKEIANSKIFTWVNTNTTIVSYGQIRSNINGLVNIADIGFIEENTMSKMTKGLMTVPGLNMLVILWNYVLKNIFTNKTADNVHYTFRGMFGWLVYPKRLHGHTVVLTNNLKQKMNRLASFSFEEEQKVLLEDARFTNKFVVYSTDQVEARYVLSTALMEHVLALEDKFNRAILLSFQNEKLYLAVENMHGLFSFPAGRLDDIAIVEELANDIATALHVAASLKLE